jgi:prepilin-type N-terminal cleavage/methylation domain-containing protein
MKISSNSKHSTKAFTLIEMIGVLAVIGILAALLVPKIFNAINNARINSTAVSINTIKTATADHYAKYGNLSSSNGVVITPSLTTPFTNFDTALVTEQLLDKPLAVAITTNVSVAVLPLGAAVTTNSGVSANGSGNITGWASTDCSFDLSDTNATPTTGNNITGTYVVVIYLGGVLEADAQALNNIIDGPALGVGLPVGGNGDLFGRVKYNVAGASGLVDVTIYITHR